MKYIWWWFMQYLCWWVGKLMQYLCWWVGKRTIEKKSSQNTQRTRRRKIFVEGKSLAYRNATPPQKVLKSEQLLLLHIACVWNNCCCFILRGEILALLWEWAGQACVVFHERDGTVTEALARESNSPNNCVCLLWVESELWTAATHLLWVESELCELLLHITCHEIWTTAAAAAVFIFIIYIYICHRRLGSNLPSVCITMYFLSSALMTMAPMWYLWYIAMLLYIFDYWIYLIMWDLCATELRQLLLHCIETYHRNIA